MAIVIRKAKRSATKLRLLLSGPSGSGKTWGAIQIARGLGGRVVVIDTEEGSSDLYDQLHSFDVIDLKPPFTPEAYVSAIAVAEQAGYDVIIVDSVTHCWSGSGGCLELLDDIAKAQFRGNTWSAWSVITPRWRAFVDKLLRSPAHVIATGRSKTETAQVDDHGKKSVAKLGMKLEARDGLEYEFTLCLDIVNAGHFATVSKDRTGLFSGDPKPITVETGKTLAAWLAGGQAVVATTSDASPNVMAIMCYASKVIAAAKESDDLKPAGRRIDALLQDGTLSPSQWETLTDQLMQKVDALNAAKEPASV